MSASSATTAPTPYERIGGEPALRRLADRFYEIMDTDPAVAALRAMHAPDLAPMRAKLGDFLIQWFGGPPLYLQRADARCMGEAHAPYAIDAAIREQWLSCMHRALDDTGVAPELQALARKALDRMTEGMQNR